MELVNDSPFATERFVAMDGGGFERLIVLAKGTFALDDLRDGAPQLADDADPLCLADEYIGKPGESSLDQASDLAPDKPGLDVLLKGHAYPKNAGDTSVDVALRVDDWSKVVRVVGDRTWRAGVSHLTPSAAAPFVRVPLAYERAFGGVDAAGPSPRHLDANPVGRGYRGPKNPLDFRGELVPNLERPDQPITRPAPAGNVAGFGPIPPHWEPRKGYAGTYDQTWERERNPLLPDDFDPRFHQVAPPDQVLPDHLRGSEQVVVIGATPRGRIEFTVPRDRPSMRAAFGSSEERLRPAADTMTIDADRMRLTLVWRASLNVQGRVPYLSAVRIRHRTRRKPL